MEEFIAKRVPAKELLKDVFGRATVMIAALAVGWHFSCLSQPFFAIPVVNGSFLSVAQYFIGLGHQFEVFFRTCSVPWIFILDDLRQHTATHGQLAFACQ